MENYKPDLFFGTFPFDEKWYWGFANRMWFIFIHTKNGQPLYAGNDEPVSEADLAKIVYLQETIDPGE